MNPTVCSSGLANVPLSAWHRPTFMHWSSWSPLCPTLETRASFSSSGVYCCIYHIDHTSGIIIQHILTVVSAVQVPVHPQRFLLPEWEGLCQQTDGEMAQGTSMMMWSVLIYFKCRSKSHIWRFVYFKIFFHHFSLGIQFKVCGSDRGAAQWSTNHLP